MTAIVSSAYIATAAAETGRFHSPQVLAMAILLAMVPGILSLSSVETTVLMVGSLVAYTVVCSDGDPGRARAECHCVVPPDALPRATSAPPEAS